VAVGRDQGDQLDDSMDCLEGAAIPEQVSLDGLRRIRMDQDNGSYLEGRALYYPYWIVWTDYWE
jgi:hypothetical protein